jgi:UDP-glucose 4-epimerase
MSSIKSAKTCDSTTKLAIYGTNDKVESEAMNCRYENDTAENLGIDSLEGKPSREQVHTNKIVLVTGGCGYIGSHAVIELIEAGYEVVVFDNLCNSSKTSLQRIGDITGIIPQFVQGCITNERDVLSLFKTYSIGAVLHFAGLKSVSESIEMPLEYHKVNSFGTLLLLNAMKKYGCKNIVFSSSATVYGHPQFLPITEDHPLKPINPYGWSKFYAEQIIQDKCVSNPNLNACLLRYFNPVGSHSSGTLGEDPRGTPSNLVPFLCRVLSGQYKVAKVFGSDYDTPDGTGVRDFIHVVDLARGHVAALKKLQEMNRGCLVYNMGTGRGYSVMEMIQGMQSVSNKSLPFVYASRRNGDAGMVVADPTHANRELDWYAQFGLYEMCKDAWKWQSMNPYGFDS